MEERTNRPHGLSKWEGIVPSDVLNRVERSGAEGIDWYGGRLTRDFNSHDLSGIQREMGSEAPLTTPPEVQAEMHQVAEEYRKVRRQQRVQRIISTLRRF